MSAAWVVGGDQMRHEQEGSGHQMWHGYSFDRAMNSANKASLAAAGIRTTLYPSFLLFGFLHEECAFLYGTRGEN